MWWERLDLLSGRFIEKFSCIRRVNLDVIWRPPLVTECVKNTTKEEKKQLILLQFGQFYWSNTTIDRTRCSNLEIKLIKDFSVADVISVERLWTSNVPRIGEWGRQNMFTNFLNFVKMSLTLFKLVSWGEFSPDLSAESSCFLHANKNT